MLKVDADLSAASHQAKTAACKSKGGSGPNLINAGSIKMVMAGTGCENAERVEQVINGIEFFTLYDFSLLQDFSFGIKFFIFYMLILYFALSILFLFFVILLVFKC